MAEGGQFPWKRQTIDLSRGPAAEYSSLQKPLPAPPKGVEWNYNSETKEWRLVRTDDADKSKYSLRMSSTWNPHTAREQSSIVPVPKHESKTENATIMEHSNEKTKDAPVENKDYIVHTVLPTDTLAGLCLRYKTKPTLLRQVNKFSGSNLLLAPSKLIIPLDGKDISTVKIQDTSCPEYKLHALVAEYPHLRRTEAKAYLEMNDWNLEESMQSVREDEAWEEEEKQLEQKRKNIKPVLNVHVAVPAEEVMDATTHHVTKTKAEEEKGLMEPLLRELELSPSGVMC